MGSLPQSQMAFPWKSPANMSFSTKDLASWDCRGPRMEEKDKRGSAEREKIAGRWDLHGSHPLNEDGICVLRGGSESPQIGLGGVVTDCHCWGKVQSDLGMGGSSLVAWPFSPVYRRAKPRKSQRH